MTIICVACGKPAVGRCEKSGPMVERVARAIAVKYKTTSGADYEGMARAAIAAMREPTEAVLWRVGMHKRDAWTRAWQAMIDAALEGK